MGKLAEAALGEREECGRRPEAGEGRRGRAARRGVGAGEETLPRAQVPPGRWVSHSASQMLRMSPAPCLSPAAQVGRSPGGCYGSHSMHLAVVPQAWPSGGHHGKTRTDVCVFFLNLSS